MPEVDHEVLAEKHYSPNQLAKLWNVSVDTVRRVFADEPGVVVIERPGKGKNSRPYRTLRIPASVALRVYQNHKTVLPCRVLN